MKKIFVTIKEFLENGGVLDCNRDVFITHFGNDYTFQGKFHSASENIVIYDNWDAHSTEYKQSEHSHIFVEINCAPIYK